MIQINNPIFPISHQRQFFFCRHPHFVNFCLLILLSICSIPNAYSGYEAELLSKIQFANLKQLSTEDGLSENTVNQIYQDEQGFIWIATELGINRYDGYRIKNLTGAQSALPHKSITHINQDSNNNFWLATESGLSIFDENHNELQMSQFPSPEKLQNNANRIVGSVEVSGGNSWVVTWNGLYHYGIKNREISQPASMKLFQRTNFNLLSYYADKNRIWLGTSQGIYFFDLVNQSLIKVVTNSEIDSLPIHRIKILMNHSIFLTTSTGFYQLDIPRKTNFANLNVENIKIPIQNISKNAVTDFVLSKSATQTEIIYSTKDAIYSFQPKNKEIIKLFSLNDVLPNTSSYRIRTLFLDSQNLLWIGTRNRGAYIWNTMNRDFIVFNKNATDKKYHLNDNNVWSIDQDNNGNYWVGTDKGLNYINAESLEVSNPFDFTKPKTLDKQAKIYDLLQLNNTLWLATANDLSNINVETKKLTHFRPKWLDVDDKFIIFSLTSITNDILWLATNIGTLKFNIQLNQFTYDKSLSHRDKNKMTRYITQINGNILSATDAGVFIYSQKSGLIRSLLPSKLNAKGQLYSLTDILFINNRLWLSYNGDGIYIFEDNELNALLSNEQPETAVFDKNNIIHLNKESGLADNSVYSLEMSHRFVWATTNTGLVRIHPKKLNHSNYDSSFGLPNNEFNEGASLLANQHLIYGGPNGLTIINPLKLVPINETLQTPKITKITLTHNKKVETLTFPSHAIPGITLVKNTTLSIQMTILDFRKTKSWEFEYWLEGKEHLLKKMTMRPEITLTNLPPGHYSLRIKARSKYDLNESKVIQLNIIVDDDLIFNKQIDFTIFAIIMIFLIFTIICLLIKNKRNKQMLSQFAKDEKRLENALLDKDRGIWEFNISQGLSPKIIIFQESHTPMALSLERYFDYIYKDDLEKIKSTWSDFLNGKTTTISETFRVYFHGELIWNYIHGKIVSYTKNGSPLNGSGIWVNVDNEKKVEERLNFFSHAFESTLDIIFILDNDLTVIAVNQAYEISTGYIGEQMIGRSMVDIAFSRFTSTETNEIKNKVIQNKRWKGESSVPRRNESSFPVDIRINIISKDGRDSGYLVVMSDISESGTTNDNYNNRFHDQASGLPNKVLAFDRLKEIIKKSEKIKKSFSLILLGIEHVEQLQSNELLDLLRLLITRLLPYIDKDDVLAKFDETHLMIILRHKLGDEETISTINQLITETIKPFSLKDIDYHISVQAGISKYPDDSTNWIDLVTKAELALEKTIIQNSSSQKNVPFSYFQESRNKRAVAKKEMEIKLSQAINNNELFLVFQPVVELKSHVIVDAEVSFRWQMSKETIIYPTQFFTIASEVGMLTKITNWMISNTLKSLHRWNQEDIQINLNFNLSSQYLLSNPELSFISQSLIENNINPADIIISLNEDCLSNETSQLSDIIIRLKDLGIALMLSEFAKNSTHLQKIKLFDFSMVRFDKSLIREIGKDQFSEVILKSMMDVIRQLGIKSVASGIENENQENFLLEQRCQLGQGFLYSDPLTENQMRQLMLKKRR